MAVIKTYQQNISVGIILYAGSRTEAGTSFTLSSLTSVSGARMFLQKEGSPTGNVTYAIYNATGSPAVPTGTAIAVSSAIPTSSIATGSYNEYEANFSTFNLSAGTYFVVAQYSGGSFGTDILVGGASETISGQNSATYISPTWTASTNTQYNYKLIGPNDQTQNGTFRVQTPPSSFPINGIVGGWGSTTWGMQAPGEVIRPKFITVITDQTQTGKFRVGAVTSKTQAGVFRTQSQLLKTQTGKFRLQATTTRTQSGVFRVQATTTRNQSGVFMATGQPTKVQSGVFRTQGLGPRRINLAPNPALTDTGGTIYTTGGAYFSGVGQVGIRSISGGQQVISATALGTGNRRYGIQLHAFRGLIPAGTSYTFSVDVNSLNIPSGTRLTLYAEGNMDSANYVGVSADITSTGRASATWVATGAKNYIAFYLWISATADNWTGNANVNFSKLLIERTNTVQPYFDGNSTNAYWSGTPNNSVSLLDTGVQPGKFSVVQTNDQNQSGAFRVYRDTDQTQPGKFNVLGYYPKPQTGKFWVYRDVQYDQSGMFRVQALTPKPQTGKFFVVKYNLKEQNGKFSVKYLYVDTGIYKQTGNDSGTFVKVEEPENLIYKQTARDEGTF